MSQYYDAFISYGRADSKAFATQLYDDLTKQGFKICFDQNDIPLGVDFQNQIDDGIEKAHNFLFIIAPHSVNSQYCLKEIELAIKHKKRIIPLVHVEEISYETWQKRNPGKTEADWEEYQQKGLHCCHSNMHPEIGKINWVFFQEKINDYDESLTDLIDLLHRHEDYVQKHTQTLVKALEWERHQKLTRYLLIAKEREGAEEWLKVEFKNEQPPCIPTDLQCEFICESLKNANNLMTQVFLSYSEKNRETMENIGRSLMRHGITVWTNQTDIKKGSKFAEEINRGIEGADTLVYLVSNSAVESMYCQKEISHALSLNKRLITLLIEPTDNELLPESIRSLEYIDLTGELSEAEFQLGVDKLIKELRENAVYYQQHKVLLVKAIKWEQQNRNRSILLRGYNLEHYQSWLEVARTKNLHPPTELQVEFIAESAKQMPDLAIDVFISYSRADADFARKLNDALQSQGKTTWFDQESIATGTDFKAEINRGIEHSDNFLFVLSPESVNSPYCKGEVEHANGLSKRFVTVLYRRVNTGDLHPELAKVQWLDFDRYGGDFLGNFNELVRTLDTDREHVREHTKKSQMALEWKRGDKTIDLLLRGNECHRAYEWLQFVEREGKQPELTEWLKEYIVASKEELERQQRELQLQQIEAERQQLELRNSRRNNLVLSGLFVSMIALLILAVLQTIKANEQTEIARIRQLAAEAESAAGSGLHQRGTLLAVESTNKFQEQNLPLGTADKALRSGLSLLPDSISGVNHDAQVSAVAFSPDGKYLATASYDNTAGVWEATTGIEVAKVNHDDRVSAVAFSPDGKYLATASGDKTARVWEATTGIEVAKVNHDAWVSAVAFSPDGKYLATASGDKTAGVWEATTGIEVAKVNHDAEVIAVAFSRDGKYLATASSDKTARVWEAIAGSLVAKVNHDAWVSAVAFSRDGKYVATASGDNTARVHFLKAEDMVKEACRRLSRNLTADEWKRYMSLPLHQYEKTCEDLPVHRSLLAEARKLVEEDKVKEAEQLLGALVELEDKIDLLPATEAIEQNPVAVVRQFQAEGKVSEGVKLANDGKVEEAVSLFEEAVELQPDIDLNPSTKEIENDPQAVARQLAAPAKVSEGVEKATDGEIEEARSLFQEAVELQPDIDLNPQTEEIENDPQAVAQRFAADGKVRQGVEKATDGEIEEARSLFQEAVELQPDIDLNPETKEIENDPQAVAQRFAADGKVRQGVEKAGEGKIEEAISLFKEAVKLQPDIDLNPETKEIENDPQAVARQFQAKSKVSEGVEKATDGEIEEARSLFQEAVELQPDIDLNPETEEIENDPQAVARQLAASAKVRQGVSKATDGEIEEAVSLFKEAVKLQPDLDLNPYQKGKQIKPEKVARRLAAETSVREGVRLAAQGRVFGAIALFEKAIELQPNIDLNPDTEEIESDPKTVARRLATSEEE